MNFTLVHNAYGLDPVVSKVDDVGVLESTFQYVDSVSNLCEALDVLTEKGYRVIVEAEDIAFIHRADHSQILQESADSIVKFFGNSASLLEAGEEGEGQSKGGILSKMKDKIGGAYQQLKEKYKNASVDDLEKLIAERKAAGEYESKVSPKFRAAAMAPNEPKKVTEIGGTSNPGPDNAPRRSTAVEEAPAVSPEVKKIRRRVNSIISQVKNMLDVDRDSYRKVLTELVSHYKEKWGGAVEDKSTI